LSYKWNHKPGEQAGRVGSNRPYAASSRCHYANLWPFWSIINAWWARQLIADYAERDRNAYHKFLWLHHLDYAETYEIAQRFGYENFNETRKLFFQELPSRLKEPAAPHGDPCLSCRHLHPG